MKPLLLISTIVFSLSGCTENTTPVMVGSDEDLDACALGMIKAEGDQLVSVRSAPAIDGADIDQLKQGNMVHMCDDQYEDNWIGVVYSLPENGDIDCGVTSPINPAKAYDGKCKSGWVDVNRVELIAG